MRVLVAARERSEGLVLYVPRPSGLGNMVLHPFSEPGVLWFHLLPRHAKVQVFIVILRCAFGRTRFGLRNHRFRGCLVLTRSRGGRPKGHPRGLAPGIMSRPACALLPLNDLAAALAISASLGHSHRL